MLLGVWLQEDYEAFAAHARLMTRWGGDVGCDELALFAYDLAAEGLLTNTGSEWDWPDPQLASMAQRM